MNLDDIIKAEGAEALKPLINAIYGQETGGGKNVRKSIDGAQGPMQVIPATYRRMMGEEDSGDPVKQATAGVRYIKHLNGLANGDAGKVAVGYFSGEGNMGAGDALWKQDHKDGNGKTVSGYASDILRRMGGDTMGPSLPIAPAAQEQAPWDPAALSTRTVQPIDRNSAHPKPVLNGLQKAGVVNAILRDGLAGGAEALEDPQRAVGDHLAALKAGEDRPTASTDIFGLATTEAQLSVAAEQKRQGVTGTQMLQSALLENIGWTMAMRAQRADIPAVPGYKADDKDKEGQPFERQLELDASTSPSMTARIKFDWAEHEDRMYQLSSKGVLPSIAVGFAAGLGDIGMWTTVGAASKIAQVARVSAAGYAARGAYGKAALSATIENAGGNAVAEVIRQRMGGEGDASYVFEAAAFGLIPGAMRLGSGILAHGKMRQADALRDMQLKQLEVESQLVDKAKKNLGDEASPDAIIAEMDRIRHAELKGVVDDSVNNVDDSRRLFPKDEDPDGTSQLLDEAHDKEVEAQTKLDEETKADETATDAGIVDKEVVTDTGEIETVQVEVPERGVLPKELQGAKPRYKTSKIEFESDIDKALYIASQSKKSKADAKYVAWLGEHGFDADAIKAGGKRVRDSLKAAEANEGSIKLGKVDHEGASVIETQMDADEFDKHFAVARDTVEPDAPAANIPERVEAGLEHKHPELVLAKTTGSKMLATLAKNTNPWIGALAQRLLAGFKRDVPILIVAAGDARKVGRATRSHYDPSSGTIVLEGRSAGDQDVQLHELSHAAMTHRIYYGEANPDSSLGKLVGEYDAVFKRAKRAFNKAVKESSGSGMSLEHASMEYFFKNIHEFTSGIFSGEQGHMFREFLHTLKETPTKSILAEVLTFMRGILGLNVNEMTALTKGLGLAETIRAQDLRVRWVSGNEAGGMKPILHPKETLLAPSTTSANWLLTDRVALDVGLDGLPMQTVLDQANARVLVHLHTKAQEWAKKHPHDAAWAKRVKTLTDNRVFSVDSTALIMLKSQNDLVRYIASELLEDASGASGIRQATASISKHLHERLIMGNVINDVQLHYDVFRKDRGGSTYGDFTNGKLWEQFNKEIAAEIESRSSARPQTSSPAHASVRAAADQIEAAYERARKVQIQNKTPGWASLPESSRGYMPHKMSGAKVMAMTNDQRRVLHNVLQDQFINIEGWDISFADRLASKYIDRMRERAAGGRESVVGVSQTGASDIVEDALRKMGLDDLQVKKQMAAYMRAGPGHTKRRIKLDLNQVHSADGVDFKLGDLFDTDQFRLLRSQMQRVSGEAALMRHGIPGKGGLELIRKAMQYGKDSQGPAQIRELEAFDQVSAEFLGTPFGSAEGKWMDRARQMTSVTKLGGIVFNQFAEYINAVVHVGAGRTLGAIGSIGRLRGEIIAMAKGGKVDNPILGSLEQVGGAEFGTDAYKLVFPFDDPSTVHNVYGRDSVGATDRILRGAGNVQAKISFWRAIHSAQQRGMAEQIVRKAARYLVDGKSDVALEDMGITKAMQAELRASGDLNRMAQFDGDQLVSLDVTQITNPKLREDFIHAIHRGTQQIIQGTFIGEQGAWAHSGVMKMMTQFRTFSLVSMEKQWARQRNARGTAQALGILMGSMTLAAPIYMSRVYLNSIGRADQDEYLEKNLTPAQIARATLNYVATSGLAGDWIDAMNGAIPGLGEITGGRTGANTGVVGNIIAPAAGTVDDIYSIIKNLDDPRKTAKLFPMSNLPYLQPAINFLDD